MVNSDTARYYFAAMNTKDGFRGFFEEIFGSAERLYIIKGGPGTGKSRFIRELGEKAEKYGRKVEYFLCSSDPNSLDGVIFTGEDGIERIGVIDGTAPHAYEPKLVGAKDSILNFGEFWDEDQIRPHRAFIASLTEAKSRLYSSAYRYLSAISALDLISYECISTAIKKEKLNRVVDRLLRECKPGDTYSEKLRIRSAIGCEGAMTLSTYGDLAKNRFAVLDRFGAARAFMTRLRERLTMLGESVYISYSPFSPDVPDAIYVPSADLSIYVGCDGFPDEKMINMDRFIDSDRLSAYKPKLKAISKQRDGIISLLNSDTACIGKLHSELESIYIKAMDFSKKEALTARMIKELFNK